MAAGSISSDEFMRSANHLFARSNEMGDGWQLKESGKDVYLTKSCVKKIKLGIVEKPAAGLSICVSESPSCEQEFENDPCALTGDRSDDGEQNALECAIDYSIVYSASYGVPVLYFNMHKPDGSLLSLEEVWQTLPEYHRDRLNHERWTFITQQEHPVLGRPYFQLHPCHTAALMEKIHLLPPSAPSPATADYLVSWLSSVASVVHLDVPLGYASSSPSSTADTQPSST